MEYKSLDSPPYIRFILHTEGPFDKKHTEVSEMKIGEFAQICQTKISVLRHYDKQGLLSPDYIDRFTGYRYYAKEQIEIFMRISALKKAGLSLCEIRAMLEDSQNGAQIIEQIEKKKAELYATLCNLEDAKRLMLGGDTVYSIMVTSTSSGLRAQSPKIRDDEFNTVCDTMEKELTAQDCQRISSYVALREPGEAIIRVGCDVIRLNKQISPLVEDINLPFADDSSIIGRWDIVGEYAVKQDFLDRRSDCYDVIPNSTRSIYFLPGGERYWCYGWTRDKLLIDTGDSTSVNDYEVKEMDGERFMFVQLKSYYYRRGGIPTTLVLRQINHIAYTARQIAKKDNLDIPFVPDERVLGSWKAHSYCNEKEDFSPRRASEKPLYFSRITFSKGGKCVSEYGGDKIEGKDMQEWTRGYVLRKWNDSACAYEI